MNKLKDVHICRARDLLRLRGLNTCDVFDCEEEGTVVNKDNETALCEKHAEQLETRLSATQEHGY